MTTLRHSFVASKYYKKLTLGYTLLFAVFFFGFSFLSQLTLTQNVALSYILSKLDHIKRVIPQLENSLNEQIMKNNQFVLNVYEKTFILLIVISVISFFSLSLYTAHVKKEEINSMQLIGVKQIKILKQLLSELIFPLILGVFSVIMFVLIFHNYFVDQSINLNRKVVDKNFNQQTLVFNQVGDLSTLTKNQKEDSSLSADSTKAILPYNKISLLAIKIEDEPFRQTLAEITKNLLTLILSSFISSIIGFYSYMLLLSERRILPE